MASFTLVIKGAPYSSSAPLSALRFAQAVLAAGHLIEQVFFYQDGVYLATSLSCPPQDELNLTQAWQSLAQEHKFALNVCIAAALKRGVINQVEAQRHSLTQHNLAAGFNLVGLGELATSLVSEQKLMVFNA